MSFLASLSGARPLPLADSSPSILLEQHFEKGMDIDISCLLSEPTVTTDLARLFDSMFLLVAPPTPTPPPPDASVGRIFSVIRSVDPAAAQSYLLITNFDQIVEIVPQSVRSHLARRTLPAVPRLAVHIDNFVSRRTTATAAPSVSPHQQPLSLGSMLSYLTLPPAPAPAPAPAPPSPSPSPSSSSSMTIEVGKVSEVHELGSLVKMRYKRPVRSKTMSENIDGIIVFEYSQGQTIRYKIKDPTACVEYMRTRMMAKGIKGCITRTSREEKTKLSAPDCFERVRSIEQQFAITPTFQLIEEIMELLRVAVEKLEEMGNESFATVIRAIKAFLSRTEVMAVISKQTDVHDESFNDTDPFSSPVNSRHRQDHIDTLSPLSPHEEQDLLESIDKANGYSV